MKKNLSVPLYIPNDMRAVLHNSLARGLDAGMAADKVAAAASDIGEQQLEKRLLQASNAISKGQSYTVALNNQGLITNFDNVLLSVGEEVGELAGMHSILSKRYETRHARRSKIKAKMMMPRFVTVFGLFILPVPALMFNKITVDQYIFQTIGIVIAVLLLWGIFRKEFRRYENQGWPEIITRPLTIIPLFRQWLLTSARAIILENLAVLMEAGIPAQQALKVCEKDADSEFSRQLITQASRRLSAGDQLAESLANANLLDTKEGFAIVSTGEAAGKLTEMLKHYALTCQVMMDRVWDQLSEWTPRVVYGVVILFIAKGILS
ncbi:MAG: general secretion pathway protein F [Gammaproteobacteria bacterium]|jgi:general secretion pathway protein F